MIRKLEQEHEVIAAVLTRLDTAAVEMIEEPARLDGVRKVAEELAQVLGSHFAYEEEELVEPIGRLNVQV
ncbi:hemerythrin domain-containing protein [Nonomuraea sp. NBC_01738]|uniref:hemerythrin domain-containing protein n=1 Tax=Nonomuraea sp. NBC_01738 TaxID=2976003 RepID=UPI002E0F2499|nr:hemerythrin domain-containing protein [Nonomuraea sp. NBC_01738]